MKVAFYLTKKGMEPGPRFDHMMQRIQFLVLHGHDVQVIHMDEKIRGIEVNEFFVDEAQHVQG